MSWVFSRINVPCKVNAISGAAGTVAATGFSPQFGHYLEPETTSLGFILNYQTQGTCPLLLRWPAAWTPSGHGCKLALCSERPLFIFLSIHHSSTSSSFHSFFVFVYILPFCFHPVPAVLHAPKICLLFKSIRIELFIVLIKSCFI